MHDTPSLSILPRHPYPGLRPFDKSEWPIFHGRDLMVKEIIDRLGNHHLIAVHGPSGCGKSSLIRAGVLAKLERESARLGVRWRTASMRPGANPMWALAEALCKALRPEADNEALRRARGVLGRGSDGIPVLLGELEFPPDHNLILLVDQFEELFRYRRPGERDAIAALEPQSFVERLVHVFKHPREGIYIVSTMRSDYLGDCAQFEGLAEAINSSHYLVPRMSSEQILEAITRPPQLYDGEVDPELAARIVRDMRGDQDNLPLMQHALVLMWVRALDGLNGTQASGTDGAKIRLSLEDYRSPEIVDIYRALSIHGNAILAGLSPDQRRVAEIMFRRLTEVDDKREIRRPTSCRTVRQLANVGLSELQTLVDVFRQPECSFIYAKRPDQAEACDSQEPLTDEMSVEISHESLIRQWEALKGRVGEKGRVDKKGWVDKEADAARIYQDLCDRQRRGELLEKSRLDEALEWNREEKPTALWARRYPGDFDGAMAFLQDSASEAEKQKRAAAERVRIKQEEIAERLRNEERQVAEKLRIEDRQAAQRRQTRVMRWALIASGLLIVVSMYAVYNMFSQTTKIESLNELLRSTNRSLATASLARLHNGPVGYAPMDLQLRRLIQLESMLETYESMEFGNGETTSSADSDDWKAAVKQAHQASRGKSVAVDQAARITLNSLWPISGIDASEMKPAKILTGTQATPYCLAKEIEEWKIPVHSLGVIHDGLVSGWHAVVGYFPRANEDFRARANEDSRESRSWEGRDASSSPGAGARQLILASVDGSTCDMKVLGPLPPNAQLSEDFEFMYEPAPPSVAPFVGTKLAYSVQRLRWYPICTRYGGDIGCTRREWKFAPEPIGLSQKVLGLTANPALLLDGDQSRKQFLNLAPTQIVDESRLKAVRELFNAHPDERVFLDKTNPVDKPEPLTYRASAAERDLRISAPLLKGQRIAAFDLVASGDVPYVAYIVSQQNEPGGFGHLINVLRLDKWLVDEKDLQSILQLPVTTIGFQGPEITGLRFGKDDGILVLESKPTQSFLEVVWSQQKLKKMVCDIYDNWPEESKQAILSGREPICSDALSNGEMVDVR